MKFGFDEHTLDAVWILNRNIRYFNFLWFIAGFLFTFSFPIAIYLLINKDEFYTLFISDLYYCLLGYIVTFAALFWSFNRKKSATSISRQLLEDLHLTQIDRAKLLIGTVALESSVITLNLLPYILGYFCVRFVIILSGITGIYQPIDLIVNFGWILIFPLLVFFWIYILRVIWAGLVTTRLSTPIISFLYFFTVLLLIFISTFEFGFNSVNVIASTLVSLDYSKGLFFFLTLLISKAKTSIHNLVFNDLNVTTISLATIYLLIIHLTFVFRKYSKLNKARKTYINAAGFYCFIYFFINQIAIYLTNNNMIFAYIICGVSFFIERIGYIVLSSVIAMFNLSTFVFSLKVPFNLIANSQMHYYLSNNPNLLLINYQYLMISSNNEQINHLMLLPEKVSHTGLWYGYQPIIETPIFLPILLMQIACIASGFIVCMFLNIVISRLFKTRRKK